MNTVKLLRSVEYLINKGYKIRLSVTDSASPHQPKPIYSLTFFNGERVYCLYTILDHSIEDQLAVLKELCTWEIMRTALELEPDDLETVVCSACAGSGMGYTPNSSCRSCGGLGEVPGEEEA